MMAIWKIGPRSPRATRPILKPAELTPRTTLRLAELAADIFPPGVINVSRATARRSATSS